MPKFTTKRIMARQKAEHPEQTATRGRPKLARDVRLSKMVNVRFDSECQTLLTLFRRKHGFTSDSQALRHLVKTGIRLLLNTEQNN